MRPRYTDQKCILQVYRYKRAASAGTTPPPPSVAGGALSLQLLLPPRRPEGTGSPGLSRSLGTLYNHVASILFFFRLSAFASPGFSTRVSNRMRQHCYLTPPPFFTLFFFFSARNVVLISSLMSLAHRQTSTRVIIITQFQQHFPTLLRVDDSTRSYVQTSWVYSVIAHLLFLV